VFHASFNRPRAELRYTLVITFPDGDIHSFPVGDAAITVGRSPATAIRVAEDGVSRQHCVISPASGRLVVLDQGSTNGTFVNGALVRQARLNDGDVVQVGSTRIRVQAHATADEAASPRPPALPMQYDDDDVTTETFEVPVGTSHFVQRLAERLACSEGAVSAAELVLDTVTDVIPVDRAYIFTRQLAKPSSGAEVLASKSRHRKEVTGELDLAIPERVLKTLADDPHLVSAAETTAAVRATLSDRTSGPVLCAPMRHGGEAFGALYLDALTLPEWAQSAEMFGFLSSAGALAALAIGRARLQAAQNLGQRLAKRTSDPGGSPAPAVAETSRREAEALRRKQRATADAALSLLRGIVPVVERLDQELGLVERGLPAGSEEAARVVAAAARVGDVRDAVADVAALVELEAGTRAVARDPVNAAALLERAVRMHEPAARDAGVGLTLGVVDAGIDVLADRELLGRVLHHLVTHAVGAAGRGGRVLLSGQRRAGAVELTVADTGHGVPPSKAESFFSPDASAQPETRRGGVELYLCALAVKALGGTLRVTGPSGNNRLVLALPSVAK
jgi:signal transduction histidine kinase